ncbi:putative protein-tyrosine phosphatase, low molecular weight [Desulfosarcina variabilis str. Montpellier]|uniref:hypothetical protein n=1 Tax=Desulfosarcina variabilis TaxID=2300 RepID=UPI003AFAFA23
MENNKKSPTSSNLLFLCIRNRVRSVFAELFTREKLKTMGGELSQKITVRSAGFFPEEVKAFLDKLNAAPPDPFYGCDMSMHVRNLLLKKGIAVPNVWQSKYVSPEMVKKADLIVVSLPEQKKELAELYPDYQQNMVTLKEIAKWEGAAVSEDASDAFKQDHIWEYWEENLKHVSKTIEEVEMLLTMGIPNIVKRLVDNPELSV